MDRKIEKKNLWKLGEPKVENTVLWLQRNTSEWWYFVLCKSWNEKTYAFKSRRDKSTLGGVIVHRDSGSGLSWNENLANFYNSKARQEKKLSTVPTSGNSSGSEREEQCNNGKTRVSLIHEYAKSWALKRAYLMEKRSVEEHTHTRAQKKETMVRTGGQAAAHTYARTQRENYIFHQGTWRRWRQSKNFSRPQI